VKPFGMLRIPILLVCFGGPALLLSPGCKGQEVSPDHFTDTGVQGVYENASVQAATPKLKLKPLQVRALHQSNSLQPAVERAPLLSAQAGTQAVAEKRKPAKSAPKKP
jgi:hypothetical protein